MPTVHIYLKCNYKDYLLNYQICEMGDNWQW